MVTNHLLIYTHFYVNITQIGDPDIDHKRWASPETMNMSRPAYQVNASCPGSDVAGDMTSAFASGYIVYFSICNGSMYFACDLILL